MLKNESIKKFIHEIYSSLHRKNYPTKKIINNHFDEIWSTDSANFSDQKFSNNIGFR